MNNINDCTIPLTHLTLNREPLCQASPDEDHEWAIWSRCRCMYNDTARMVADVNLMRSNNMDVSIVDGPCPNLLGEV